MPIQFVDQVGTLSVFTPTDEETGEPLPTETWSDKLWATGFAEALALDGLALAWGDCVVYHRRREYAVPAGSHAFAADAAHGTSVTVWLDPAQPDNLTIDEVLLDGTLEAPPAPEADGDAVRLAWGTIGAGAAEFTLAVLRHRKGR